MEKEQAVIHEANLEIMNENEKAKTQIADQADMIDTLDKKQNEAMSQLREKQDQLIKKETRVKQLTG